jgi:hypothetical protein
MRPKGIGRLLLGLGMGVGVLAGVGLLVGFEPARLPPALLNIAAYKLTFGAALGLIVAGAAVVRYGRRDARNASEATGGELPRLGEGAPPEPPIDVRRARERARERSREPRA